MTSSVSPSTGFTSRVRANAIVSLVGAIGLGLLLPAASWGQAGQTKGAPAPPAPPAPEGPDRSPLARFVPADGLTMYVECAGLEAHGDAWKQSAAYKILNDTPTGAMLEDVIAQLIEQTLKKPAPPNPALAMMGIPTMPTALPAGFQKATGAEIVGMVKLMLNSGFVYAMCAPTEKNPAGATVLVIRGAAKKGVSGPFARVLGASGATGAKLSAANRASRRVVLVDDPNGLKTKDWGWWGEKDKDLVIAMNSAKAIEVIAATIDGKQPNATTNPIVTELSAASGAFQPIISGFIDLHALDKAAAKPGVPAAMMTQFADKSGVNRVDFRWGVDGPAVMSVVRVLAPSPRKPPLSTFEPGSFDPTVLPPISKNADSLTVTSVNLKMIYDLAQAQLQQFSPSTAMKLDEFAAQVKTKTRLRLKEDVLGKIGPKMALYTVPSTSSSTLNIGFQVPKATLIAEVTDAVALGKALDELALMANKEFKAAFAEAPAPAGGENRAQPNRGRAPAGGGGSSSRRAAAPEFKMSVGTTKTYVLQLPPAYAALTNLQLTVSLGKKHLVISTSSPAAKEALALESAKEGLWKPTGDLVSAFQRLPKGVFGLRVADPSDSLPNGLATLPAALEKSLNVQIPNPALAANGPGAGGGPPGGGPPGGGPPGAGGRGGMRPGMGGSRPSGDSGPPPGYPGRVGGSSSSGGGGARPGFGTADGGGGSSSAPGGGSPPGQPGSAGATAPGTVTIKVDPSKIPQEDAIKAYLFPGYIATASDAQGFTITTRVAFPSVLANLVPNNKLQSLMSLFTSGPGALLNAAGANRGQNNPPGRNAPGGNRPPGTGASGTID